VGQRGCKTFRSAHEQWKISSMFAHHSPSANSAESCCRPPRSFHPNRAIRSSTTAGDGVGPDTQSAKRRSREIFPVLATSPPHRLRSALRRGDLFDAGTRTRATKARASITIEKAGPRAGCALTGEERSSSRSPSARDGHRFESPQLHQEVGANGPGFATPTIRRQFSALARRPIVCGAYSAVTTGLGRRTRK
jgi:hypothetical protein